MATIQITQSGKNFHADVDGVRRSTYVLTGMYGHVYDDKGSLHQMFSQGGAARTFGSAAEFARWLKRWVARQIIWSN